ncbi:MAG: glycosyltransferase family 4 protein [Candidatus Colwellbacteria bacterium]|nr:glycosyltransferase family 4 protein [Candidatus Colwellbacteria bacterium]
MKNYITKSSQNLKIIILSDQPKERISGPNVVISNIFPFLEKHLDIKWKVTPALGLYKIKGVPHSVKAVLFSVFSFFCLLFDKEIRDSQIINGHGVSSWLITIWLSKIFKKISIITSHEVYEYTKLPWFFGGKKLAKWVWNYTMKNAQYIIDVSGTIKSEKAYFIPNGVDIKKFAPGKVKIKKDKKTVLFVGRLSPEKGIEYYLEASQIIKHRLGEGVGFAAVTNLSTKTKDKLRIMDLIRKSGVNLIPGALNMPEIYRKADVFVLPSISEAFGLVNLEAMASGVPVVATNVGGVPNVVKDGVVGFLVPPKDSQAIAQAVIKILEDDQLREKMRENCLAWVKNFTWDKIAKQYLEFYQKVI